MTELDRQTIEARIGYRFRDQALLDQALTHASVAESRLKSNERLEFLGDAVLGMVVCRRIFELYPDLLEGEMTKIKSTVVSRLSCAGITAELGLAQHLALGKGMRVHESLPQSLAAAVLESVAAAIYLDGGEDAARDFLLPHVEPLIVKAFDSGHQENFKSILQQHAQQNLDQPPQYVVLDERGPDHAKHFHVCVQVGAQRFPASWGASKKSAEQQAALLALLELGVVIAGEDGKIRVAEATSPVTVAPPATAGSNAQAAPGAAHPAPREAASASSPSEPTAAPVPGAGPGGK